MVGSCFPPLFLKDIKDKIKNAPVVLLSWLLTVKETKLILAYGLVFQSHSAAPVGRQLLGIIAGFFDGGSVAKIINQI